MLHVRIRTSHLPYSSAFSQEYILVSGVLLGTETMFSNGRKALSFAATNRFKSMFLEPLLICCFLDLPGIKVAGLLIRPIHRHGQLALLMLSTRMEQ